MKQYFPMSILGNVEVLPTLWWIRKMSESPVGTRIITASKQCIVKFWGTF